jgi:hypothetical protein
MSRRRSSCSLTMPHVQYRWRGCRCHVSLADRWLRELLIDMDNVSAQEIMLVVMDVMYMHFTMVYVLLLTSYLKNN